MPSDAPPTDSSWRLPVWVTCLGLALGMGCERTPAAPPHSPEPKGPSEPDEQRESPRLPMPHGQEVSFTEQLARVEKLRRLEAKRPVRGLALSTEELLGHVKRSFELELPDYALSASEEALVALGVVPSDFDYEATMLSLLSSSLAGLYDPRLEAMFVHEDLAGAELEGALLHELVHALQDQHYELDGITKWELDGTDRSSALSCLAEGDATSATWDGMFEEQGRSALDLDENVLLAGMNPGPAAEGDPIPPIIRRSLLAPYSDGVRFVHELRRKGGWAAVDTVWTAPPQSTEQVLHSEKYFQQEPPVTVSALPAPDTSWDIRMTDVWGEQSLRLVFEEWTTGPQARQRAAGWGGDRLAVYQKGEERAVTWHLLADDEEAAKTYFETFLLPLSDAAKGQTGRGATDQADDFVSACEERPSGPYFVARAGRRVAVLAGPFQRGAAQTSSDCTDAASWYQRVTPASK